MTTRDLKLARLVKTLLDLLYGLLIFVSVGLVLWMAVSALILGRSETLGTASVPVRIGVGEEPQFDVTFGGVPRDAIQAAFVDEAEGTLRLETGSALLVLIANAAKLVVAGGLIYILHLLRGVVGAVLEGDPFAAENGSRLRRLGNAVLALGFLAPAVEYLAAAEILKRLPGVTPALQPGPTFDSMVLFAALFILLLAHVWSYGLELERDRALTV